jgi:hypothetical protein
MGKQNFFGILFWIDLVFLFLLMTNLISLNCSLPWIVWVHSLIPFMLEELDSVEAHILSDKSPGPASFSSHFLKVCSPVIKFDFYHLYDYFWGGNVILQCINDSFVTLIPKIPFPECAIDFWPICLLNIFLKLFTKILANHL